MNDHEAAQPQKAKALLASAPGNGSQPTRKIEIPLRENRQLSTGESIEAEQVLPLSLHKATGPRTIQGKQRRKYNALKFGVYAKNTVATSRYLREDATKFRKLLQELMELYQPEDLVHALMVEDFASLTWRIARVIRTETELVAEDSKNNNGHGTVLRIRVGFGDEMRQSPAIKEMEARRDAELEKEPAQKQTVPFLVLPSDQIDAFGRQEDRLRRHWFRLYHELERRRSLVTGQPVAPRLVVEVE